MDVPTLEIIELFPVLDADGENHAQCAHANAGEP
jgi:hypothetical protein